MSNTSNVVTNPSLFIVHFDVGKDICVNVTTDNTCDKINEHDVLIVMCNETTPQKTEQLASEDEDVEEVGNESEQLDTQFDLIKILVAVELCTILDVQTYNVELFLERTVAHILCKCII